jgi:hypothetical protein
MLELRPTCDNHLGRYPAQTAPKHRPVDVARHREFAERIRAVPPDAR